MSSRTIELSACVSRWLGRGLALLLFLFWGAFFVEHLAEWFSHPQAAPPPLRAWVAQGLHLVMLIGLALMLRGTGSGPSSRPWGRRRSSPPSATTASRSSP